MAQSRKSNHSEGSAGVIEQTGESQRRRPCLLRGEGQGKTTACGAKLNKTILSALIGYAVGTPTETHLATA
jgi:hypothetical protein